MNSGTLFVLKKYKKWIFTIEKPFKLSIEYHDLILDKNKIKENIEHKIIFNIGSDHASGWY